MPANPIINTLDGPNVPSSARLERTAEGPVGRRKSLARTFFDQSRGYRLQYASERARGGPSGGRGPGRWLFVLALPFLLVGCSDDTGDLTSPDGSETLRQRFDLATLGSIPYPEDNPPVQERIELGRLLFYDPILGGERDVSCGTCHHPDFAFGDARQFGAGVSGTDLGPARRLSSSSVTGESIHLEPRNSQTILNTAFNFAPGGERPSSDGLMFWDGRVTSLEVQATKPIESRVEMKGDKYSSEAAFDSVLNRLRAVPEYVDLFETAFPDAAAAAPDDRPEAVIDSSTYARAIAAFERELVGKNSAFDRYVRGDDDALTELQKQGLEIFFTTANCAECHGGPMFSNFEFRVTGVPQEGVGKSVIPGDDTGREEATRDFTDRYAFRVPSLRNVGLTAPYMHDGVFQTLEQVVRFYNQGARPRHPEVSREELDPAVREPLGLSDHEIRAVVAFLRSLNDPGNDLPELLVTVPDEVPSGLTPVVGLGASE